MSKRQVNFRLPDELIAALKDRAESEGITSTELATRLLEAGLGLPSPESKSDDSRIKERIAVQLAPLQEQVIQLNQSVEGRIMAQLTTHLAPLQGQVLELSQCIADHIPTQIALLQEQLDERVERINKRIEERIAEQVTPMNDALGESDA